MSIRSFEGSDREALIDLSIRAWTPVFASLERVVGSLIFRELYPEGWRGSQRVAVRNALEDGTYAVWVAEEDGQPLGFVAADLHGPAGIGEIHMVAVDPDHQGRGVGVELTRHALGKMKDAGLSLVIVETGGDPAHAPARALYERVNFMPLPIVRYYKRLQDQQ